MRGLWVFLAAFPLLIPAVAAQGAEACGVCHSKHLSEWQASPHATAWTSERFQSQLKASGDAEFCARCHAPLSIWSQVKLEAEPGETLLLAERPAEPGDYEARLADVPEARTEALEEGVNCGACHVVQVFSPAGSRADFVGPYHSAEGHAGRVAAEFRAMTLCGSCHGREASAYSPDGGVPAAGSYHAGAASVSFKGEPSACRNCHMPVRSSRLVQLRSFRNLPMREVGNHTFAEQRYAGLEDALVFSVSGSTLLVTNQGIGHPFPARADMRLSVQVFPPKGNEATAEEAGEAQSLQRLPSGETAHLTLPFQLEAGESLTVVLMVARGDEPAETVLRKTVSAN